MLENGDYAGAREILQKHLATVPADYGATALLAASFAAEAGVSLYELTSESLGGGPAEEQDVIAKIVPEPTAQNILLVKSARDLIQSIPEAALSGDMSLGATLYVSVYTLLLLKEFAASPTPPTLEQALEILDSLDDAASLAAANKIPAAQIEQVRNQIAAEPGADEAQKLNSYIEKYKAQNGGQLPTPPPSPAP